MGWSSHPPKKVPEVGFGSQTNGFAGGLTPPLKSSFVVLPWLQNGEPIPKESIDSPELTLASVINLYGSTTNWAPQKPPDQAIKSLNTIKSHQNTNHWMSTISKPQNYHSSTSYGQHLNPTKTSQINIIKKKHIYNHQLLELPTTPITQPTTHPCQSPALWPFNPPEVDTAYAFAVLETHATPGGALTFWTSKKERIPTGKG